MSLYSNQIELLASTADCLVIIILQILAIYNNILFNEVFLSFFHEIQDTIWCCHQLDVLGNLIFLSIVDLLHGCFQQPLSESGHIMNGTINEELFDEILIWEGFYEPQAQADVFLESIPDQSNIVWKNRSFLWSEAHRQKEGHNEFESFKLVLSPGALKVKGWAWVFEVVSVLCDSDVFEDT